MIASQNSHGRLRKAVATVLDLANLVEDRAFAVRREIAELTARSVEFSGPALSDPPTKVRYIERAAVLRSLDRLFGEDAGVYTADQVAADAITAIGVLQGQPDRKRAVKLVRELADYCVSLADLMERTAEVERERVALLHPPMTPAPESEWRPFMEKMLADPDEACPGSVYLAMALRVRQLEALVANTTEGS